MGRGGCHRTPLCAVARCRHRTRRTCSECRGGMYLGRSGLGDLVIQVIEALKRTPRNAHTRGSSSQYHVRGWESRDGCASAHDHRLDGPAPWRDQRVEIDWQRTTVTRHGKPTVKPSGLPHPTPPWDRRPVAVTIRHPSPWIGRCKHITVAGIKGPRAIHKRIPTDARKVRLPHHPVTRNTGI